MRELPSEITAWADEIRTVYSGTLAVGLYPQFRSQLVVDDTFIYSPRSDKDFFLSYSGGFAFVLTLG